MKMKINIICVILVSFTLFSSKNKINQYNFDKLVFFKNGIQKNAYLFSTLNKNYYFSFTDENPGILYENSETNKRCLRLSIENKNIILKDDISKYWNEKNKSFKNLDFIKEETFVNDSIMVSTLFTIKNNKKNPKKKKVFEIYSFVNEKCFINEHFLNSYTHGYFQNTDFKTEILLPFKIIHYDIYSKEIDTIHRIKYKEVNTLINL